MARALLFALLAASVRPIHCQTALSETSYEVDIISPSPGGRYRVNPDRGIAVVIAIQNGAAARQYGWGFSWEARSSKNKDNGRSEFLSLGNFGFGHSNVGLQAKYDIHDSDDLYIGLTHEYLYSTGGNQTAGIGQPMHPMPPGEYVFTWHVSTGPICWNDERSRGFSVGGNRAGEGSFAFTIADEAPWPDLKPSPCAAVAAQASFNATGSSIVSWVVPTSTPLGCYATKTVTEPANPCRVTLGPEQARQVSSLMSWVEGAPPVTRTPSGSVTESAVTLPPLTREPGSSRPSSSSRMSVSFGWLAMVMGILQAMQFAQ